LQNFGELQMTSRRYELQIHKHDGSGRYTLQQREAGNPMWADLHGALLANTDLLDFHQALVKHLVILTSEGHEIVSFVDTAAGAA
jgi:hypothetical protein